MLTNAPKISEVLKLRILESWPHFAMTLISSKKSKNNIPIVIHCLKLSKGAPRHL